ncbi:rod shape-determining protein, partial [Clostridium perfringens]|uniref:rod shape-determining protein n=1 Tax=Clostridium perfringens TaxID=1502 RepID=UPI00232C2B09
IVAYIKKKHNLLIGERSAEKLKVEIGTAMKDSEEQFMKISGIIYNNYFYLGGCYEYEFFK